MQLRVEEPSSRINLAIQMDEDPPRSELDLTRIVVDSKPTSYFSLIVAERTTPDGKLSTRNPSKALVDLYLNRKIFQIAGGKKLSDFFGELAHVTST